MLSIKQAKELIGETKMSDAEIQKLTEEAEIFLDIIFEDWLGKRDGGRAGIG